MLPSDIFLPLQYCCVAPRNVFVKATYSQQSDISRSVAMTVSDLPIYHFYLTDLHRLKRS